MNELNTTNKNKTKQYLTKLRSQIELKRAILSGPQFVIILKYNLQLWYAVFCRIEFLHLESGYNSQLPWLLWLLNYRMYLHIKHNAWRINYSLHFYFLHLNLLYCKLELLLQPALQLLWDKGLTNNGKIMIKSWEDTLSINRALLYFEF